MKKLLLLLLVTYFNVSVFGQAGGVANLQTWLRADMGTTGGTPLTGWANQAGGTATVLNGSPNLITANTSYNYNPYVDFTAPSSPRQFISLSGLNNLAGNNYTSLFFVFQLNDLSRTHTHVATVNGVSMSSPTNGTLHGDVDAGGTQASILLEAYDAADFGTSSPAGTWKRNGTNIASNSVHSTTKHLLSANCTVAAGGSASGNTVLNRFLGGQDDNGGFQGHTRDWRGPVAEVVAFTTQLTAAERNRVESYLAVKYGITLSTNYVSTGGGTIFTTAAPYANDIIGIGRDDTESLNQKQSHYNNDLVRIYLSNLAATNATNAGSFTANQSYVMMGDNAGFHCAQVATNSEIPTGLASCAIYSRYDKEWKVTRTNMADNYNMDVQLSPTCGIPGSVNVADLRLLVDDDGNFSNGGTTCYMNGDASGIVFSYANPYITIRNISITHIPNNATRFITIASVNSTTPLPVGLLQFDAELNANGRTVDLTWSTSSEHDNDHFKVEKLNEKNAWETLFKMPSKGESTSLTTYEGEDLYPHSGINYYRLKQVDKDGAYAYSEIRAVNLEAGSDLKLFPNPANSTVTILLQNIEDQTIRVTDAFGRIVSPAPLQLSKDLITLDISMLAAGVYHIAAGENAPVKLVVSH